MKRVMILSVAVLIFTSCSDSPNTSDDADIIDLSGYSSIMVYSEVYNILTTPDDYVGKTIRLKGRYTSNYLEETDTTYYFVLVSDETACCEQGMEFVLNGADAVYPEDGTDIEICGTFESYSENGMPYYHIMADEIICR